MIQSQFKNHFILIALLLFSSFFIQAQTTVDSTKVQSEKINITISGQVIDESNEQPIEYAIVKLTQGKNSKSIANTTSDNEGKFNLIVNSTGNFNVTITLIGYESKTISNIKIDSNSKPIQLESILVKPSSINLDEVVIEGNYKLKIDVDKKIYKMDKNALTANGTAGDVLQNIPSVFVEQNGTVKLRGGKVKIYIDGKPSNVFGISRSQILDYIPANLIESIEVINDPSSKYDADGSTGIINIVLKNSKKSGANALLSLGAGTTDRYNGSVNFSYNLDKFSFFTSYDVKSLNVGSVETKNRASSLSSSVRSVNQDRDFFSKTINQNLRVRTEYRFNKKNTFGFSFLNSNATDTDFNKTRYRQYNGSNLLTNVYDRQIDDEEKSKSNNVSLSYTKKFKKSDQQLNFDLFYSKGTENTDGYIFQNYYNTDLTPSSTFPDQSKTYNTNDDKNIIGQIDYTQPLKKKAKLEFGLKTRYKTTNVDYRLDEYYIPFDSYITNPIISNQFTYSMNINSAYATYRKKIKTFSYKFGVRVEESDIKFKLGQNSSDTKQNFTDFFPSVYFLKELKGNNKLTLRYSRRIDRPSLREINPIQQFNDPFFLNKGNPNLKPEYTNSFDITNTKSWKKNSISSSLYYRQSTGTVQRVILLDNSGVTTTNYQNLKNATTFGAELASNFQLNKWWKVNTSLNLNQIDIDGTNIGSDFKSNNFSYNWKLNTNLNLWKNSVFQVSGNYQSEVISPFIKNHEQYYVNTSFKQYFMNKRLSLTLRCSDVFNTLRRTYELEGSNYYVYSDYKKDTRVLFVGLTYRLFGANKKIDEEEEEEEPAESNSN
jgi:ferric enterobactin receptor